MTKILYIKTRDILSGELLMGYTYVERNNAVNFTPQDGQNVSRFLLKYAKDHNYHTDSVKWGEALEIFEKRTGIADAGSISKDKPIIIKTEDMNSIMTAMGYSVPKPQPQVVVENIPKPFTTQAKAAQKPAEHIAKPADKKSSFLERFFGFDSTTKSEHPQTPTADNTSSTYSPFLEGKIRSFAPGTIKTAQQSTPSVHKKQAPRATRKPIDKTTYINEETKALMGNKKGQEVLESVINETIQHSEMVNDEKSILAGRANAILAAAKKHHVDPILLTSIICVECGYGRSPGAKNLFNFGGIMQNGGASDKMKAFVKSTKNLSEEERKKAIENALNGVSYNLHKNYLSMGLLDIKRIGDKYAPEDAKNDPKGTNKYWKPQVNALYRDLLKNSQDRLNGNNKPLYIS